MTENGLSSRLEAHHFGLLSLCDTLETIADSLPNNLNEQALLSVSRSIYPLVCKAHRFEEEQVFPRLQRRSQQQFQLSESLERLRFEHWEDESFAEEISDQLRLYVTDPTTRNTAALSYMLRGFFEGLRRHIAFEIDHLMPILHADDRDADPAPEQ